MFAPKLLLRSVVHPGRLQRPAGCGDPMGAGDTLDFGDATARHGSLGDHSMWCGDAMGNEVQWSTAIQWSGAIAHIVAVQWPLASPWVAKARGLQGSHGFQRRPQELVGRLRCCSAGPLQTRREVLTEVGAIGYQDPRDFDWNWPELRRIGARPGEFVTSSMPCYIEFDQICPGRRQTWRGIDQVWPELAQTSLGSGQRRAETCQFRPNLARTRPNLARKRPKFPRILLDMVNCGPNSADISPPWEAGRE